MPNINMDNLVLAYADKNHGCVAYLEPKGISIRPATEMELLHTIVCILEALVVCMMLLHE